MGKSKNEYSCLREMPFVRFLVAERMIFILLGFLLLAFTLLYLGLSHYGHAPVIEPGWPVRERRKPDSWRSGMGAIRVSASRFNSPALAMPVKRGVIVEGESLGCQVSPFAPYSQTSRAGYDELLVAELLPREAEATASNFSTVAETRRA